MQDSRDLYISFSERNLYADPENILKISKN